MITCDINRRKSLLECFLLQTGCTHVIDTFTHYKAIHINKNHKWSQRSALVYRYLVSNDNLRLDGPLAMGVAIADWQQQCEGRICYG